MQKLRGAWGDFRNVAGHSPAQVLPRMRKVASVLFGMIRGDDVASSRLPIRVQIEITDKCNFDCIMCNRLTRPTIKFNLSTEFKEETFARLIDEIRPYYITLNGLGEPALNKGIDKILKQCRNRGIRSAMPSNMSIKKAMLEKVAPNPPDILTFSMHGATQESFEAISVNSKYAECMELFETFMEEVDRGKVEIRILCALQAKNLNDAGEFYDHLSKWGLLDKFVLLPVDDLLSNGGAGEIRRVLPTKDEVDHALADLDQDLSACADPSRAAFLKRWRTTITKIKAFEEVVETGPCLIPWFSTYITARGTVLPCCYLTDEHHALGNIHEQDFASIWNGPKYRQFRHELRENRGDLQGCRNCPRNDAERVRRYNPASLIRTKWNLDAKSRSGSSPPDGATTRLPGAVLLSVKGSPLQSAARESPPPLSKVSTFASKGKMPRYSEDDAASAADRPQ